MLDVAVSGDYAFLIDNVIGLLVFDISNPPWPVMVGYLPLTYASAIAVSGMYAYIAGWVGGALIVVDVSSPSQPYQVTSVSAPLYSQDLDVVGDYAFVVGPTPFFSSMMIVIDISQPATSHSVGALDTQESQFRRIAVSQQYAYIIDTSGTELWAADVKTPSSPGWAGFYHLSNGVRDLEVSDGFVYLSEEALVVFWDCALSVFGDDFESGDTSAWSATAP